jgi:glycosyltransferase involved in cell wall biosynthesis
VRIALVTGIFPPDIGGPATHSADLTHEFRERGHTVMVVTLGDDPFVTDRDGVLRLPRRWPWPVRHGAVAAWLVAHRHEYDAVYATGLHPAAVAGAKAARRPVVAKVVGDPAWERGRRRGLTDQDFEQFRASVGGPLSLRAMRALRDWSLRRADVVVAPSRYLAGVIEDWLGGPADVQVVPNGVRVGNGPSREGSPGPLRVVWVGRLVPHKRVDRLIQAVAQTPGVELRVIGDGPERGRVEGLAVDACGPDRVRFLGSIPHEAVLEELKHTDALLLASDYEGLPHVVIEAFACGVPLVGPPVGGTGEVLRDGDTGIAVSDASVDAFAAALVRLRDNRQLLSRLSWGARREGEQWRFERTADDVERALGSSLRGKPRVVFLGKTRTLLPPARDLRKKYEILLRHFEPVLVNVGRPGVRSVGRVRTVLLPDLRPAALGGALFYAAAPAAALGLSIGRRHATIVCQSPYEGIGVAALAWLLPRSVRPKLVIEVHGDWRTATRVYGSSARRALSPLADRLAAWGVQKADRVRVVGRFTRKLVDDLGFIGSVDQHVAFADFAGFMDRPVAALPNTPTALFVGVLEPYKGPEILVAAWERVVRAVPEARLVLAGDGPMRAMLERVVRSAGLDGSISFAGHLCRERVAEAMDDAWVLVLPSRSEGLPRVVLESTARGRPVVGSRAGGIQESVEDGITGLLVDPEDPNRLAEALVELLTDAARCSEMGREGRRRVEAKDPATEFGEGVRRLAEWVAASPP